MPLMMGDDKRLTLRLSSDKQLMGLELGSQVEVKARGKVVELSLPEENTDDGEKLVWPGRVEIELEDSPNVSINEMDDGILDAVDSEE